MTEYEEGVQRAESLAMCKPVVNIPVESEKRRAKDIKVGDWIEIHGDCFEVLVIYAEVEYFVKWRLISFLTDDGISRKFPEHYQLEVQV